MSERIYGQSLLECDGVNPSFFYLLSKENKQTLRSCKVQIPFTVLFEQGYIKAVFYNAPPGTPGGDYERQQSDSQTYYDEDIASCGTHKKSIDATKTFPAPLNAVGEVKRKTGKDIDIEEVYQVLTHNESTEPRAIVAVVISASPSAIGQETTSSILALSTFTNVTFLTSEELRIFLFGHSRKPRCILQEFIYPPGATYVHKGDSGDRPQGGMYTAANCTSIFVVWTPLVIYSEAWRSRFMLSALQVSSNQRCATFELKRDPQNLRHTLPELCFNPPIETPLSSSAAHRINEVIIELARHFEKTEKLSLLRISACFKLNSAEDPVLQYPTCIRMKNAAEGILIAAGHSARCSSGERLSKKGVHFVRTIEKLKVSPGMYMASLTDIGCSLNPSHHASSVNKLFGPENNSIDILLADGAKFADEVTKGTKSITFPPFENTEVLLFNAIQGHPSARMSRREKKPLKPPRAVTALVLSKRSPDHKLSDVVQSGASQATLDTSLSLAAQAKLCSAANAEPISIEPSKPKINRMSREEVSWLLNAEMTPFVPAHHTTATVGSLMTADLSADENRFLSLMRWQQALEVDDTVRDALEEQKSLISNYVSDIEAFNRDVLQISIDLLEFMSELLYAIYNLFVSSRNVLCDISICSSRGNKSVRPGGGLEPRTTQSSSTCALYSENTKHFAYVEIPAQFRPFFSVIVLNNILHKLHGVVVCAESFLCDTLPQNDTSSLTCVPAKSGDKYLPLALCPSSQFTAAGDPVETFSFRGICNIFDYRNKLCFLLEENSTLFWNWPVQPYRSFPHFFATVHIPEKAQNLIDRFSDYDDEYYFGSSHTEGSLENSLRTPTETQSLPVFPKVNSSVESRKGLRHSMSERARPRKPTVEHAKESWGNTPDEILTYFKKSYTDWRNEIKFTPDKKESDAETPRADEEEESQEVNNKCEKIMAEYGYFHSYFGNGKHGENKVIILKNRTIENFNKKHALVVPFIGTPCFTMATLFDCNPHKSPEMTDIGLSILKSGQPLAAVYREAAPYFGFKDLGWIHSDADLAAGTLARSSGVIPFFIREFLLSFFMAPQLERQVITRVEYMRKKEAERAAKEKDVDDSVTEVDKYLENSTKKKRSRRKRVVEDEEVISVVETVKEETLNMDDFKEDVPKSAGELASNFEIVNENLPQQEMNQTQKVLQQKRVEIVHRFVHPQDREKQTSQSINYRNSIDPEGIVCPKCIRVKFLCICQKIYGTV